jgi:aryl-alcohol dehydrogenase-like predicted oxidoreductase
MMNLVMELRPLANTGIMVSPVAFGAWPIAGLTSPGTSEESSLATVRACFDLGINHVDTAYCYGIHGESERLVGQATAGRRDQMVIATKGGLHWDREGKQAHDASPAALRRECEESLRRLQTDYVDLYYLHAPDPKVPVGKSAAALRKLMEAGKTRSVGVSNVTVAQLEEFAAVCPIAAYQPPYNMLQRQIEADALPWCRAHNVAVLVYWPLMKGLLAGKLRRDQSFADDSRRKYPMFRGKEYQKNLDLVEKLRAIAAESGHTVAQLVVNWTIRQPGITAALCGAKRPEQIRETAGAAGLRLTSDRLARIDQALTERGKAVTKAPV